MFNYELPKDYQPTTYLLPLAEDFASSLEQIKDDNLRLTLSTEFYSLADKIAQIKEKQNFFSLAAFKEDLSCPTVQLSKEMEITLSYVFTHSNVFPLFKLECDSNFLSPEDWLYSFARRSVFIPSVDDNFIITYKGPKESFQIVFNRSLLINLFGNSDCSVPIPEYLMRLASRMPTYYNDSDTLAEISKGYLLLKEWMAEQNARRQINCLRRICSKAVVQYLNK